MYLISRYNHFNLGGTVDITVHEVRDNGSLKELHKANGGDWGGTKVDALFTSLLADIFGKDVMETFSSENKYDFLDLLRDFETKKRTISPELNEKVTFNIPSSLSETVCVKNPGSNIKDVTSKSKYKTQVTWIRDKLRMDAELMRALFDESCEKIVAHIKELFMQSSLKNVSSILLVGGFAESLMLQTAIREAFKNKTVIIPQEAGLAVLKGAVLCGHEPQNISGRICRYTYGIEIYKTFDRTIHPQFKKVMINNKEHCKDIFHIYVRVGQIIEVGKPQVKETYIVTEPDQDSIDFRIFTSNNREPTYTTDVGCTHLGTLTIGMPDISKGLDRGAIFHMTFSGTEIAVTAVDKDNPERAVTTKVDFLG